VGEVTGTYQERFEFELPDDPGAGVEVCIVTARAMSVAMVWHVRLLLQVAVLFQAAKWREERQRSQQYMRAVHETGARLTHDVKNLLQSLDGLVAAAGSVPDDGQVRQLVSRQLPEISRRLSQTLLKLQQPDTETVELTAWLTWWEGIRVQYEPQGVCFVTVGSEPLAIAADVFSSVADNFLQNALQKRKSRPALAIMAEIRVQAQTLTLAVEDDGEPVEAEVLRNMFEHPVASRNGLGIGLHQAARMARARGIHLDLAVNQPGRVRFEARLDPGVEFRAAAAAASAQPQA
jgi:C4-dicarboxylate-specific signal transduction histidine kinase